MKRKKNKGAPADSDRAVQLGVDIYDDGSAAGAAVCLSVEGDHARVQLPLTPHEARLLASHLLLNARSIDPTGHAVLIDRMAHEVGQRILLEAFVPGNGPAN